MSLQIKQPTKKRVVRWLAAGGAALAVVWGSAWWGVPKLVQQQLELRGTDLLGRAVTVGAVDFSPWSLQLTVHDVKVAGVQDGDETALLRLQRVYVDASMASLWHRAPVLDALELDAPQMHVALDAQGRWNFQDIVERLAPAPDASSDAPLPSFALYNIAIRDGQLQLQDGVVGVHHTMSALQLQLPFVSNLPTQREVKVEPALSLDFNGSQLSTEVVATPFAKHLSTQARLKVDGLDVAPYLAYWPTDLPVQLQSAVLSGDVQVAFQQAERAQVRLTGQLSAQQVQVNDRHGAPWLAFDQLHIGLADVRPLERYIGLGRMEWHRPHVQVQRAANGQLLPGVLGPFPAPSAPPPAKAAPPEAAEPWTVALAEGVVHDGQVQWNDAVPQGGGVLRVHHIKVHARDVGWPLSAQAQLQLQAQLSSPHVAQAGALRLQTWGSLEQGRAALSMEGFNALAASPYVAQYLRVPVQGTAKAEIGAAWNDGRIQIRAPMLAVDSLVVGAAGQPQAGWSQLALRNVAVDVAQRDVQVGQLDWLAPQLQLARNAQGRWMFERWLKPQSASLPAGNAAPWAVRVGQLKVQQGAVEVHDAALPGQTFAARVSQLQVQADNVALDGRAAAVQLSMNLAERLERKRWGQGGTVSYQGTLQPLPLRTEGKLKLQRVPLQMMEPYVAEWLNVRVVKALAGFDGDVKFAQRKAGPEVVVRGHASLRDWRLQTQVGVGEQGAKVYTPNGEDLLRWKELALQGISVALKPGMALRIAVGKTQLKDFYARVVVLPQGRLNLQNLLRAQSADSAAAQGEQDEVLEQPEVTPVAAKNPLAPRISVGPVELQRGTVKFSDYFIQPNYTADLTGLSGHLGAFTSDANLEGEAPQLADLVLQGVVQGSAKMDVAGKLNPLASPLALDVHAQVRDLDLSPLTPYAIKYAGHGIERGKLSMDVAYAVQPDGQLVAKNQLVLQQLNFGDAVEGAPSSLPVKLAVALLADSEGVIDVNLPISGSLNDPQFRVAPLVFQVLGNLVRKAVTAPFSLLAGAMGVDSAKSEVVFAPGAAVLDAAAQTQLVQVAKVLQAKPMLKLTLVGQSQAVAEQAGWQAAQVDRMLAERLGVASIEMLRTLPAAQRDAALKALYRAKGVDKPRNLVGLPKDVPAAEMRQRIARGVVVPAGAMDELAIARAQHVRAALLAQGAPADQVFLGASAAGHAEGLDPRVLLNLSIQ